MLSRRRAEGEPDYLREVKNEFMAQWDGIRYAHACEYACQNFQCWTGHSDPFPFSCPICLLTQ